MISQPNIQYLKKNFDEIGILTILAKVRLGNLIEPTFEDEMVLQALRRSKNSLEGASLSDIGEYLTNLSDNSIGGLVNNVKGILHEIEYVAMENSDGDTVMAGVFEHTNHKDFDVWKYDASTGDYTVEQLKTTDSESKVREWINSHPNETIVVNDELAERLDLESSGLNNEELEYRVEDVIEKLIDLENEDNIWDYFPGLTTLSLSFIVWGLYVKYKNREISLDKFKWMIKKATGMKVAKIAMLMVLLSIPIISFITGVALTFSFIVSVRNHYDSRYA